MAQCDHVSLFGLGLDGIRGLSQTEDIFDVGWWETEASTEVLDSVSRLFTSNNGPV